MSGNPASAFAFAVLLVALGGFMAVFPANGVLEARNLGKKVGKASSNTRILGIALILLGLLLIGMGRLIR